VRLFGTDGVRGRANEFVTPELAFDLARAAGMSSDGPVVIGRDTRRSGSMLASALHSGFNTVGVDTVDLGVIPVGAVSCLSREIGAQLGVMVSASHNPAEDNGVKFFDRDGAKLSDDSEFAIEQRVQSGSPWPCLSGLEVGVQSVMDDAVEQYVKQILSGFEYDLSGIEFAVDCANGAAIHAAPLALRSLGAVVEVFAAEPDGANINDGCGATNPSYLAKRSNGRVGLCFDGDADRLIAIDEDGASVNGDVLMAVFARYLKERNQLQNDLVVTTVMSNLGFSKAMERIGVKVLRTPVGDRYVLEEMRRAKAVLGGEQSGHILLSDRSAGDGIRTALQLAAVITSTGRELRELRKGMKEFPQVLENVSVARKEALVDSERVWIEVADAERRLADDGRVLVRASGTEPLIRVMVEASTVSLASEVASHLSGIVAEELG